MPKKNTLSRLALLAALPLVAPLLAPGTALAGNTSVLVVLQDGMLGIIELQIPDSVAKDVEAQLAKGKFPVINTDCGKVQMKGLTRGRELLAAEMKDEPLILPPTE